MYISQFYSKLPTANEISFAVQPINCTKFLPPEIIHLFLCKYAVMLGKFTYSYFQVNKYPPDSQMNKASLRFIFYYHQNTIIFACSFQEKSIGYQTLGYIPILLWIQYHQIRHGPFLFRFINNKGFVKTPPDNKSSSSYHNQIKFVYIYIRNKIHGDFTIFFLYIYVPIHIVTSFVVNIKM